MSLINFLNAKLKPTVDCDAVCEDGYACSNLIADDTEQLLRGFMAFSVTKPPVEITFEFPKAIDLKVIKLWNSYGALRSTAFEIHGKYEGIWERVAYVRDLAKDVDCVTFCYQSDYSSRNSNNTEQHQPSETVFFFKTAHRMLSNTNSIKLIIRATHKCAPVLRKIQMWGLPARSLDKADRELIKSIWSEVTTPFNSHARQRAEESGQRSPLRCVPELNTDSPLQIPEEFLDAITWELMIFPTVLPSGKIVDQSTIDKHSEEEAKWGRLPSDPFTGLEFTAQRKAILNLALKARIEKFLMENSEHFKSVPRSLGSSKVRRSKNRHASQFANIYHTHGSIGTYSSLSKSYKTSSTATLSSTENLDLSTAYIMPAKRVRLNENSNANMATVVKKRNSGNLVNSLSPLALTASTATQTSATATSSFTNASAAGGLDTKASTASSLSSSSSSSTHIDTVIQQTLQKITRFTQLPLEGELKVTTNSVCIRCQTTEFAYQIQTCGHLVCRKCLVRLSQQEKCSCNVSFRSSDVERYHKLN